MKKGTVMAPWGGSLASRDEQGGRIMGVEGGKTGDLAPCGLVKESGRHPQANWEPQHHHWLLSFG